MRNIEAIIRSVEKLPPFPVAVQRAMEILDDTDASVSELISVIKYDQAITANVLKLCNSAYYGLRRKVHSLRDGLVLLGNDELKDIILAGTVVEFFQQENKGYELAMGELWRHAIATAIISKIISDNVLDSENHSVFTAALLHDIGKVVLGSFVEQYFEQMFSLVFEKECSFTEAETEILGINHAEVGGKIAELWLFPEDIVQAIRLHHDPGKASDDDHVTPIVYLANIITLSMGIGVGCYGLSCRGRQEIMKRYRLRAKDLERMMVTFYDKYHAIQDIFKLN
ncbi:MAG: HDOD domain-containing protein [Desulfobacterales bacterium]|nr:HDOD domain-containing protein [Desulfobacterales bacterium]